MLAGTEINVFYSALLRVCWGSVCIKHPVGVKGMMLTIMYRFTLDSYNITYFKFMLSVSVCLSACLPACLPVYLSACMPTCLSVCLSVSLSDIQSVFRVWCSWLCTVFTLDSYNIAYIELVLSVSVCLAGYLPACLPVCMSDCMSVWHPVGIQGMMLTIMYNFTLDSCNIAYFKLILPVCLSVCPSVCLCVCLFVSIFLTNIHTFYKCNVRDRNYA